MTEKRFTWEYSHNDSTGEIIDWIRNECLMTDYLQKYELEEWCQELNKIVDENNQLRKEIRMLKILYCKCQDCANADLYVPHFTVLGGVYTSPRCKITGKEIMPSQSACEDFERAGRNSR